MSGPVLTRLGETALELGPVADGRMDGLWRKASDDDGIVWLVLDGGDGPLNTISRDVLEGLARHLDEIETTPPNGLVIRSSKAAGFAAGADIKGFDEMSTSGAADLLQRGHDVLDRLEALSCPTVAIVHGAAFGAGFELALACDARIAVAGASFGFPEVRLGLHPGLGGTFRLTGLIDPLEAMTMMLTGSSAHTSKARRLGIADTVCEERHVRAAVSAFVGGDMERHKQGLKAEAFRLKPARSLAARQMRTKTEKKAPAEYYPAPYKLIALWEEHGGARKAMQAGEIESFAELLDSEASRNLRRVFFLQQALKEQGRGQCGIDHVHVIGAGAMGAEIAGWAASNGKSVTLNDVEIAPLGKAVKIVEKICEARHFNGIETRDTLDRFMPDPDGLGIAHADLVIEAGPEDAELKRKIYAGLGAMKPDAILATNTSSLALRDLADGTSSPAQFAGLHFFNPVSKMQLVEVVAHGGTSKDAKDRLTAFCGDIDRLPIRIDDYPGFLVNRALTPYLLEAMVLMDDGIQKEVIDAAATRFGMPMGPVALADQVGLDICLHVAESLDRSLDKTMAPVSETLRARVEAGQTGKKAGQGFYDWSNGAPDPETRSGDVTDDLTDRLILPMLDACVECLREGIVESEDAIDGAMIFATGFPPFLGGPMHYARKRGADDITTRLNALADRFGPRFRPDTGWVNLR